MKSGATPLAKEVTVAHERLLPRHLGPADLLISQLLHLPLRSRELAVDRFELGLLLIHLARVRGHTRTHFGVQLRRSLVQLAHFGRRRLDLGVLGDVVGCLARLIALIPQGAELLNVVAVVIQVAGWLDDDSAAPRVVNLKADIGSAFEDPPGSASLVSTVLVSTVFEAASCPGDCSRHSADPWGQSRMVDA